MEKIQIREPGLTYRSVTLVRTAQIYLGTEQAAADI
jgi:hypothetical protein